MNALAEFETIAGERWDESTPMASWLDEIEPRWMVDQVVRVRPARMKIFGRMSPIWLSGLSSPCDFQESPTVEDLRPLVELTRLEDGWNGTGSAGIESVAVQSAIEFARAVSQRWDSVAPTNDGAVLFEWERPEDRSLFAEVTSEEVAVTLFDDVRTYVDLVLPPGAAARLVSALLFS
jgi:hypothetical protein